MEDQIKLQLSNPSDSEYDIVIQNSKLNWEVAFTLPWITIQSDSFEIPKITEVGLIELQSSEF